MDNTESVSLNPSFINPKVDGFKRVNSIDALKKIISECENTKKLENCDFSDITEISCLDFDGWELNNIVFSQFSPRYKEKTHLFQLSFIGANLQNVSFAHSNLQQCNFDAADIENADFFYCEFNYCRFRKAKATYADFRYSQICNCTLSEYEVHYGDFYFCNFLGSTSFVDSKFKLCSFTFATFEHACIRMDNIENIIQEKYDQYYKTFLNNEQWHRYNPCSFVPPKQLSNALELPPHKSVAAESMNFYKLMSGIYAGKGLNRDSNEAYRMKVLEERKYYRFAIEEITQDNKSGKDLCKGNRRLNLKLKYKSKYYKTYLIQAAGYGYKWWAPCIWFLILVFFSWAFFQIAAEYSNMDNTTHWLKNFAASFNNSLSPFDGYYNVVNMLIASLQSAFGILLIGFLGFVVANRIRNDS